MNKLLGIVGSNSQSSKTKTAIETTLQAADDTFDDVKTDIIHLAAYDIEPADGRKLEEYTGDTAQVLEHIIGSDAFIIGTPVYRGSYSGLLKNLLDIVPRGKWQSHHAPFKDRPIGLIATGATDHHYLSVAQELGPIISFFGAYQVGGGVYVNADQFDKNKITDEAIVQRLQTLGRSTAELSQFIDESQYLSNLGPQF